MAKFLLIVIAKDSVEEPYTFFCESIQEVRFWHEHVEECHTSESRHFVYHLYSYIQEVE